MKPVKHKKDVAWFKAQSEAGVKVVSLSKAEAEALRREVQLAGPMTWQAGPAPESMSGVDGVCHGVGFKVKR